MSPSPLALNLCFTVQPAPYIWGCSLPCSYSPLAGLFLQPHRWEASLPRAMFLFQNASLALKTLTPNPICLWWTGPLLLALHDPEPRTGLGASSCWNQALFFLYPFKVRIGIWLNVRLRLVSCPLALPPLLFNVPVLVCPIVKPCRINLA